MSKSKRRLDAVRRKMQREREEKAAKRAQVFEQQPPLPGVPAARLVTDYSNARTLATIGPLVKGSWSVPPALAEHLKAANRPIPQKVEGFLLIDTGATETCMALDVAQDLKLTLVRIAKTYGAGGLHENPVFEAFLVMENRDTFGNVFHVESLRQVVGIPELGRYLERFDVKMKEDHPKRVIGLLGREFLEHATMIYRGPRGLVEIILDPASFRARPSQ